MKDEGVCFSFEIPSAGGYIVANRTISKEGRFKWEYQEKELKEGKERFCINNPGGVQVINVVAAIPKLEWEKAKDEAKDILNKFKTHKNISDIEVAPIKNKNIEFYLNSPVEVTYKNPEKRWIVFTDSFNSSWKIKTQEGQKDSWPIYSAVNGFFIEPGSGKIVFEGQKEVEKGKLLSVIALFALGAFYIGKIIYDRLH